MALNVQGDRFVCRNCALLGNQDTLYAAAEGSRQYYDNCYIEGTVDFIFGKSIAVFQSCTIKSLSNAYITAAATPGYQSHGFVFFDCKLIAAPEATKVYLGRPWRPNSHTVFIRSEMGNHILPAGWDNWGNPANEKTAYYAEYKSTGPGAAPSQAGSVEQTAHRKGSKSPHTLKVSLRWIPPWPIREKTGLNQVKKRTNPPPRNNMKTYWLFFSGLGLIFPVNAQSVQSGTAPPSSRTYGYPTRATGRIRIQCCTPTTPTRTPAAWEVTTT